LIVTITIADKTNAIMQSIGLVLFLVGIVIPVRALLRNSDNGRVWRSSCLEKDVAAPLPGSHEQCQIRR
jgi:hypothetical protein